MFVLVAGDGDYTPLVQRLREFGKHVVGVGTEANASSRLVSVCLETFDLVKSQAATGSEVTGVSPNALIGS